MAIAIPQFELRLLRCTLTPSSSTSSSTSPPHLIDNLLTSIENGNYQEALNSEAAHLFFHFAHSYDYQNTILSADQFYSQVEYHVQKFLHDNNNYQERVFILLCIAVAAFLAFTQNNITGPCADKLSLFPFPQNNDNCNEIGVEWDGWARNQIMSTGSDLCGKFSLLQYIVFAKMLLSKIKDVLWEEEKSTSFTGIKTISWWLGRVIFIQQRILDDTTSSLFDSLQVLNAEMLKHFGKVDNVETYWGTLLDEGEASTIVAMAHLEAGIVEYAYARVDQAGQHFDIAEEASALQLSVTGILGFRTVGQVDARAQKVLVANTIIPSIGGVCPTRSAELRSFSSKLGEDKLGSHSHEIHEASDILLTPKLLENEDPGMGANGTKTAATTSVHLVPIQQAVILARCLVIEKNTSSDEIQRWDIAPFIEAIDAQELSYFIIQCFCDILRVRWESTRSHTKERALLVMEKKVQSIYDSSPEVVKRIPYSFGVYVPTIPELRKEFGELLVRCGLIGEALKVFEDLELWDNLIHCYSLLEKKAAAVELIKKRLCEVPNDPRLWCSLGDVTNSDAYYEKALEVSSNRSARAKRSLARSAYNKGDYEASKVLWESALALNSLYADGWFALGAAALKARDTQKALEGFTRAVKLDPDNGEAWNNIACLHVMKNRNKEALIAFRQALQFRRNSWQLWENYSQVALNIGNFREALEATIMVLNMTHNKRINADLLERTMTEIETRISKHNQSDPASSELKFSRRNHLIDHVGDSVDDPKNKDSNLAGSRETEHLVEFLGKALQQIVRSGGQGDMWGLYARWLKIKGDTTMRSEALLKQVRSYQGADMWNDRDRFKKFASASLQLCEVYMEISQSTGSRRELNAAEMHLRNTVKQVDTFVLDANLYSVSCMLSIPIEQRNHIGGFTSFFLHRFAYDDFVNLHTLWCILLLAVSFSELEEFRALQNCLDEVRKRLNVTSVPSAGNL
ncbi:hypothetical protein IFM89_002831 [Coptis chinensis]|uniref:Tetratricopeptide repeat protein 27 homolog n=1 Tax=Coptis chinensis TaxID=261450 RepID=A0A835HQY2_9MAGN|nr:hypothetical protein IFM89_002831 [Coptis chinensis]